MMFDIRGFKSTFVDQPLFFLVVFFVIGLFPQNNTLFDVFMYSLGGIGVYYLITCIYVFKKYDVTLKKKANNLQEEKR
ncbi:MAG: hypothetical protein JJU01_09325 [Alkalibacterium sp.]|nr:hypothetical protein [Alkalibacterium sp.]